MSFRPRELGYRMPAEWEPHAATWLSWPHKEESWPGKFASIPAVFAEIVRVLSPHEQVHINVCDADMEESARSLLQLRGAALNNVRFHQIPTNDAWCRDHGPMFIIRDLGERQEMAVVDWGYNSWGGKYPPFDLDDQVPARVAEVLEVPCFMPGIVMEGGSLDVNGDGALLTTESCLLNPNRNPGFTKQEIEGFLGDFLGVTQFWWLGQGIAGDDTDGHVDDLARFVSTTTVVTVVEEDPMDENYKPLRDNLARLQRIRDRSGKPIQIVTLPMPAPLYYQGQRLPCSYANFYIANGVVLVPTYDSRSDTAALDNLRRLFPSRTVIGIDARDLVWGLGACHCVTQQQPLVGHDSKLPANSGQPSAFGIA